MRNIVDVDDLLIFGLVILALLTIYSMGLAVGYLSGSLATPGDYHALCYTEVSDAPAYEGDLHLRGWVIRRWYNAEGMRVFADYPTCHFTRIK